MSARLYILAGIPGSGKTTWAKKVLDAHWVSSDDIRYRLMDEYDASRNGEVFDVFYEKIENYLDLEYDVIADATNLTSSARERLRQIAERFKAETHLILFTNVEQAVLRNAGREGREFVPAEGMENMLDKYELTLRDLLSESYTTTTYVSHFS